MDNIYGQSEQARNDIVQIPDGYASNAGNTLYAWLGSLWRGLHQGDLMVRGLQEARGLRLAQLYINILEAVRLQDRNGAPVFHRELWHPIVVRRSQRDQSQENLLRLGGEGDRAKRIGPQLPGTVYAPGETFRMGRMANMEDFVSYPMDVSVAGGALTIVDNIVNPTVRLERDVDFVIEGSSIVFARENDPLAADSAFEKDDLPNIVEQGDGTLGADVEAVLWASDVLVDKGYIADHLSYALGAASPSTDVVKRILNAAWDATTEGLSMELVQTLLAAMLNVPVIQNERETVVDISREYDEDGAEAAQLVYTDRGCYRVSRKARLRKSIQIGSVLLRGTLLDETLRIYSALNAASSRETGFSVPVEQDIPSVALPPEILRARVGYGVYTMWGKSAVKVDLDDPHDANGNPHLYFDVGGRESDVAAFWKDIWDRAEANGVSMADIIGEEGSLISPASFVLKHLVGANTLFVVVDKAQADDSSMMRNPMFFDMLSDVVPSAIRLFLVEHSAVGEDDRMDLGEAGESHSLTAALPEVTERVSEASDSVGVRGDPTCGERVSVRFVRPSPVKIRGKRKSNED